MEIVQNKFAFFANFSETIRQLPTAKQAQAYQALCEYGIYGILPDDESLRTMCLMAKASIFKEDGRKSNGGNHNPMGKNQYTKTDGQSGQSWSKLVNVGQSGQSLSETETETETETKTEIKEKTIKKKKPILSVDDVNLGEYEIIRPQVKKWLEYKQQERGERYKTEMSLMVCVKKLYELSGGDPIIANDIVENSIANRYQGLVLPKNSAHPNIPRMSFKEMKEMQKEMDIQKVLRGEL